ncbi:STAS domain-containing protein [Parafrankia irregularis]|uniref:STAS domain-containing protein n=1 Tax=Parafrankia irregularis TaxID=795642 RepID=A0A0S4QRX6_9ACTN|nr:MULTISPECIES: STAS domain-containing protein [Parafrankia]MBE3201868.1 STAS domain-containing protein [Parafrankia sp. CH37]CUU58353.1 STAS domain-containing protein [Parafrankia irregularis]
MPEDPTSPPPGLAPVVFHLPAAPRRDDLSGLCGQAERLLRNHPGQALLVDATAVGRADLVVVEAVARLALVARRHNRAFRLEAPAPLRNLLALTGLAGLADERPSAGPATPAG